MDMDHPGSVDLVLLRALDGDVDQTGAGHLAEFVQRNPSVKGDQGSGFQVFKRGHWIPVENNVDTSEMDWFTVETFVAKQPSRYDFLESNSDLEVSTAFSTS
jgi:hypothetical protein